MTLTWLRQTKRFQLLDKTLGRLDQRNMPSLLTLDFGVLIAEAVLRVLAKFQTLILYPISLAAVYIWLRLLLVASLPPGP